jgi:hypothetical protein
MPRFDKVPPPTHKGKVTGYDDRKMTITIDDRICYIMPEIWDWCVENITIGMEVEAVFVGRSNLSRVKEVRPVR